MKNQNINQNRSQGRNQDRNQTQNQVRALDMDREMEDGEMDHEVDPDEGASPGFIGSVLLAHPEWNKDEFVRQMKASWGIDIIEPEDSCDCGCHDSHDGDADCDSHNCAREEHTDCGCDHDVRRAHEAHGDCDCGSDCDCTSDRDSKNDSKGSSVCNCGEADCDCGCDCDEPLLDDSVYAMVGDLTLVVTMMPLPIPNGEAEHYAGANFMWKDAVEQVKKHRAHILVAVIGEGNPVEKAALFTKAVECCLHFDGAIGVYSDGAVFEKKMYLDFAAMLKQEQLCIPLWVWFGLYFTDENVVIYTFGMKKFGKDEMEFLIDIAHQEDSEFLNSARYYLMDIANYVIASDVTLNEGETLGISQDHHILIQKREGIAVDGMTLQMEYHPAS